MDFAAPKRKICYFLHCPKSNPLRRTSSRAKNSLYFFFFCMASCFAVSLSCVSNPVSFTDLSLKCFDITRNRSFVRLGQFSATDLYPFEMIF